MEFTPEQQAHIDSLIAEKTKGLFTEDELQRKVTSEVDRRVESGIQKGLETHKSKWEQEFKSKAQLSAEELAQQQLEDKLKELSDRENQILKRSNTLNAKDLLANADIPKNHYEKFIDLLVSDNEDSTKENVQNFINTFNETKSELETSIKKQYVNVPQPSGGNGETSINKDDFDKMTYIEKIKLKETHPDKWKEFIK